MGEYYLQHHGINGQKWGVRRYQNEDGSLTPEGRVHYQKISDKTVGKVVRKSVGSGLNVGIAAGAATAAKIGAETLAKYGLKASLATGLTELGGIEGAAGAARLAGAAFMGSQAIEKTLEVSTAAAMFGPVAAVGAAAIAALTAGGAIRAAIKGHEANKKLERDNQNKK